jgi:hypothetical protein
MKILVLSFCIIVLICCSVEKPADLIVLHANIYTVDSILLRQRLLQSERVNLFMWGMTMGGKSTDPKLPES